MPCGWNRSNGDGAGAHRFGMGRGMGADMFVIGAIEARAVPKRKVVPRIEPMWVDAQWLDSGEDGPWPSLQRPIVLMERDWSARKGGVYKGMLYLRSEKGGIHVRVYEIKKKGSGLIALVSNIPSKR